MTVYASRNATTGEPWRPEPPRHVGPPELERTTEPPLLTHLWRQHFERQPRQEIRR
ncbi:multiple cyclophane-containing RiPP AmcA [Micromonospora sp. NBC_01796]|uniref:multiple cyclophane-containing RiPP AmcA n=1 Tax=Micromonospora sp. NBC_01796 TaxID=2975987 RepID=UPI002DD7A377|nr:multiple cyclophane-containing RiPP AmcA [Micromonospora sp. NBC_01796]